jgi:hypothetical protein
VLIGFGITSDAIGELFTTATPPASLGPGDAWTPEGIELPTWLVLALYTLGAGFACLGALGAVAAYLGWRLDPARPVTRRLLARAIPVGTLLAVTAATAVAAWRNYATSTPTVFAECAAAALVFALAITLGRLAAVRAWWRTMI